jgi:hypothetical protein
MLLAFIFVLYPCMFCDITGTFPVWSFLPNIVTSLKERRPKLGAVETRNYISTGWFLNEDLIVEMSCSRAVGMHGETLACKPASASSKQHGIQYRVACVLGKALPQNRMVYNNPKWLQSLICNVQHHQNLWDLYAVHATFLHSHKAGVWCAVSRGRLLGKFSSKTALTWSAAFTLSMNSSNALLKRKLPKHYSNKTARAMVRELSMLFEDRVI